MPPSVGVDLEAAAAKSLQLYQKCRGMSVALGREPEGENTMKSKKDQKRLHLASETLRTLRSDEVRNIVGGAAQDDGGGPAGAANAFTDSFSISWGGNHCCCNG